MRLLPLALLFALSPLVVAGEHDHAHTEHASLGRHEHGVGELDVVLAGGVLELELRSPAANLLGFEHAPRNAEEQRQVARLQEQLGQPQALFVLPAAAGCRPAAQQLDSPLFASHDKARADEHEHDVSAVAHSEVQARYRFDCGAPQALDALDAAPLLRLFPATVRLQVQLIGPRGQQGGELTAGASRLTL